MQELLIEIATHPFEVFEVALSIWGACGFLVFMWGFIGYFISHGHVDHQDHARAQMVWGFILTLAAMAVWVGVSFFAQFF